MWIFRAMTLLATYLADNGIRQIDFARAIGTTQPMVSKLARGGMMPTLDLAYRIHKATGGSVPLESWVAETPLPATKDSAA